MEIDAAECPKIQNIPSVGCWACPLFTPSHTIRTTTWSKSITPAVHAMGRIGITVFVPLVLVSNLKRDERVISAQSWNGGNTKHNSPFCNIPEIDSNMFGYFLKISMKQWPDTPSNQKLCACFDFGSLDIRPKVLVSHPILAVSSVFLALLLVYLFPIIKVFTVVQHKCKRLFGGQVSIHHGMMANTQLDLSGGLYLGINQDFSCSLKYLFVIILFVF